VSAFWVTSAAFSGPWAAFWRLALRIHVVKSKALFVWQVWALPFAPWIIIPLPALTYVYLQPR
jgi:hypothetical protein